MDRRERLERWIDQRLTAVRTGRTPAGAEPWTSLVGADGGEGTLHAVRWAAKLTPNVHLLHASKCGQEGVGATPEALEGLAGEAREVFAFATKVLEDPPIGRHVADSSPAPAISSAAENLGVDLVAVNPHLDEPSRDTDPGHVAMALAHQASRPILFAKAPPREGEVLVGLGSDQSSPHAAVWAIHAAVSLDAPLRAVHVFEGASRDDVRAFPGEQEAAQATVLEGDTTERLVREVEERGPALTVIGHGRHRGWIGSTARAMIEDAPGPLLVVPQGRPRDPPT